jgi:hypothetical protein
VLKVLQNRTSGVVCATCVAYHAWAREQSLSVERTVEISGGHFRAFLSDERGLSIRLKSQGDVSSTSVIVSLTFEGRERPTGFVEAVQIAPGVQECSDSPYRQRGRKMGSWARNGRTD